MNKKIEFDDVLIVGFFCLIGGLLGYYLSNKNTQKSFEAEENYNDLKENYLDGSNFNKNELENMVENNLKEEQLSELKETYDISSIQEQMFLNGIVNIEELEEILTEESKPVNIDYTKKPDIEELIRWKILPEKPSKDEYDILETIIYASEEGVFYQVENGELVLYPKELPSGLYERLSPEYPFDVEYYMIDKENRVLYLCICILDRDDYFSDDI